jgi:3-phenylpropionate/trans-cinnamate dioxygenase ferredoxin component
MSDSIIGADAATALTAPATSSEWKVVCAYSEISASSARRFDVVGADSTVHRIAIARIGDDLFAIGDRCSHADVSLAEGTVWDDECQLECIKHGSMFSLLTGAALTFPATRPVPVFEVKRVGNDISVRVPGSMHSATKPDSSFACEVPNASAAPNASAVPNE